MYSWKNVLNSIHVIYRIDGLENIHSKKCANDNTRTFLFNREKQTEYIFIVYTGNRSNTFEYFSMKWGISKSFNRNGTIFFLYSQCSKTYYWFNIYLHYFCQCWIRALFCWEKNIFQERISQTAKFDVCYFCC